MSLPLRVDGGAVDQRIGGLLLSKCLPEGIFVDGNGRHNRARVFWTKGLLEIVELANRK